MRRRNRILLISTFVVAGLALAFGLILWQSGVIGYFARIRASQNRHSPVDYRGDGTFFDVGPDAGIDRFAVDFGPIDLTSSGEHTYVMSGLPRANFNPYIMVATPLVLNNSDRPQTGWGLTSARLQLLEDDKLLFDVDAPLNEWIWSGPIGSNTSTLYLLDGTFDASSDRTYQTRRDHQ